MCRARRKSGPEHFLQRIFRRGPIREARSECRPASRGSAHPPLPFAFPVRRETSPDHAYTRMLTGMKTGSCSSGKRLFVVGFDGHRLQIFRIEDLPAVQTLHIVDTVTAGDDRRFLMVTGG